MTDSCPASPFRLAGAFDDTLSPPVRDHFLQTEQQVRYRGVMRRIWRPGGLRGLLPWPALKLAQRSAALFADTGTDVPFELDITLRRAAGGECAMFWERRFYFPGAVRRFNTWTTFDLKRGCLIDRLGSSRVHEAQLHFEALPGGGAEVRSGRQWLRLGPVRLRIPGFLTARGVVREWESAEIPGRLEMKAELRNPLLGVVMIYEGWFERFTPPPDA